MSDFIGRSFRLNLAVLKLFGLCPPKRHSNLYRFYSILIYAVSVLPSCVFGILRFVFDESVSIANYSDLVLFGIMTHTLKLLPFVMNGTRIQECILYFDRYASASAEHRSIIEDCVAACRRNSRAYFAGCVILMCCFFSRILLAGSFDGLHWLPDALRRLPCVFFCIHVNSVLGVVYIAFANSVVDPLSGGLCHHASARLRVLKRRLQLLDKVAPYLVYRKIIKCVRLYQDVVNFVAEYEKCFSTVVFGQFTGSVLVMGMCCFQLITTNGGLTAILNIFSMSLLCFQIFFYCYYGTLLIEENNSLVNAIYMSRWYEYSEQSKKALLILMERSKKPLIVTAGKVLDLSLETFTLILRRSYSLVAVLKNF